MAIRSITTYDLSCVSIEVNFGAVSAVYERENCKLQTFNSEEAEAKAYGKLVINHDAFKKITTLNEFVSLFKKRAILHQEDDLGDDTDEAWEERLESKDIVFPLEEDMECYFVSYVQDTLEKEKFLLDIDTYRKEYVPEKIIIKKCFYNESRPAEHYYIDFLKNVNEKLK